MIDELLVEAHETTAAAGDRGATRLDSLFDDEEAIRTNTTINFIHTDRLADRFIFDAPHTTITHRVNPNSQRDAFSLLAFETSIENEIVNQYSLTDGSHDIDAREFADSKLVEIGNSISNALIDEWAEGAPAEVTVEPPTRRTGVYPENLLPNEIRWMQGVVPVFETTIEAGTHRFNHVLLPSSDVHIHGFLGKEDVEVADFPRSIEAIVAEGALGAERRLNDQLAKTEVEVRDWSLRFTKAGTLPEYADSNPVVGATFDVSNTLDGQAYVGFNRNLAYGLAYDLLDQTNIDTTAELTRSIVRELSLHILSSFSDGWANAADGSVDYTPPAYTDAEASEVLEGMAKEMGDEYVFVFSARFATKSDDTCQVLVSCRPDGVVDTAATLETLFPD